MVTNPNADRNRGKLATEATPDYSIIDGFFVPHVAKDGAPKRVKIFSMWNDKDESVAIRIHPIRTNPVANGYLEPKYTQISALTVTTETTVDLISASALEIEMEILRSLPPGFGTEYNYGLGFPRQFDRLIKLIEETTVCSEIAFEPGRDVRVDEKDPKVLRFGLDRFAEINSNLNGIQNRGSDAIARISNAWVRNNLAPEFALPPATLSLGRMEDSQIISKAAANIKELSDQERDKLIDVVTSESAALATKRPESFHKLQQQVELVSLERLIAVVETGLKKNRTESYWQRFFEDNQFALQMVFGAPLVIVQSGASVGGTQLDGRGGKIADYLMRNTLSNNVALVEIKTPQTPLLHERKYRGGVYAPSRELNGAITQVLDQAHKLVVDLPTLAHRARRTDLESYSVSCVVIAGRSPRGDEPDHQKSFELNRGNSRNVKVVTYDEVFEQLKILRDLLKSGKRDDEATL